MAMQLTGSAGQRGHRGQSAVPTVDIIGVECVEAPLALWALAVDLYRRRRPVPEDEIFAKVPTWTMGIALVDCVFHQVSKREFLKKV
jgi:hypothetical protein